MTDRNSPRANSIPDEKDLATGSILGLTTYFGGKPVRHVAIWVEATRRWYCTGTFERTHELTPEAMRRMAARSKRLQLVTRREQVSVDDVRATDTVVFVVAYPFGELTYAARRAETERGAKWFLTGSLDQRRALTDSQMRSRLASRSTVRVERVVEAASL